MQIKVELCSLVAFTPDSKSLKKKPNEKRLNLKDDLIFTKAFQ